MDVTFAEEDARTPDVAQLLARHLAFAREVTPAGHVHALDVEAIADPTITLFGARHGGDLVAVGALHQLDAHHAEIKSMHVADQARGHGVGRAMLEHLVAQARRRGYGRVSLETGTMTAFAPARRLYEAAGFTPCPPFGRYTANPHSICMTLPLTGLDPGAAGTAPVYRHGMAHPYDEVRAAADAYVETRRRIDRGEAGWDALAEHFTDDAVYIDPAWGRIEGLEEIRRFFVESMVGLEDWRFPVEHAAVDGDTVFIKWLQILPGTKVDGSPAVQSGVSTLLYAGDGRFRYEEDLLNMAHVLEDLQATRWRPGPGFHAPPDDPDRDFTRPDRSSPTDPGPHW